jgi:hypothetical protein
MIEEITPGSVASEVRLLRDDARYEGAFLFVEGGTDASLLSNYVIKDNCLIRMVKNRTNVLKLISILESEGYSGFLAIVDADFWHLEGKLPPSPNVFITDTHDIETMIFSSPAFDKLLTEYIPIEKLDSLMRRYKNVRFAILTVAQKMAYIRWINYKNSLGISFYSDTEKSLPVNWESAIDIEKFVVDLEKLINIVCTENMRIKLFVKTEIVSCEDLKYDLLQFCNGHDVVYVTFLVVKRKGRNKEVDRLVPKDLEKALRLAYESTYFRNTGLYREILGWQERSGKRILAI